jgi:hypothetical protein
MALFNDHPQIAVVNPAFVSYDRDHDEDAPA